MQLTGHIFDKMTTPIRDIIPDNDVREFLPVAYLTDSLKHASTVLKESGARLTSATSGTLRDGRKFVIVLDTKHCVSIQGRRFSEVRIIRLTRSIDTIVIREAEERVV